MSAIPPEPKARKRSASVTLTTMVAGASLSVAACDASSPAQWNDANAGRGEQVQAFQYASLEACKTADEIPDAECDAGYAAAQKDDAANGPRYAERATCEAVYGDGNCVPRSSQGGGSFFGPLLAGFVIGQMLDGGGRYRGTGLYRRNDDYGGGYTTGWGGGLSRDYATGRTTISRQSIEPPDSIRQAPPRVQTRTSVVSRGGFGGGRGFGG